MLEREIPEVTEKVTCEEKKRSVKLRKGKWGEKSKNAGSGGVLDFLFRAGKCAPLFPSMLRANIINQSTHFSDTPANLNLSWNFLTIHKTASGTGSDLLLLTQQAGPILLIRVQLWPGHQDRGMVGLGVASMTGQKVGVVTLDCVLSLETLGDVAEPVSE